MFQHAEGCLFKNYSERGTLHEKQNPGNNGFGIFRGFNSSFGGSGVDVRTSVKVLHILDPTGARGTAFEPVFGPRLFWGFFWEKKTVFPLKWFKEKDVFL